MSVKVVERVLYEVFKSVDIVPNIASGDRWKINSLSQEEIYDCIATTNCSTQSSGATLTEEAPRQYLRLAPANLGRKRYFIVDGGASLHLISWKDLSEEEKQTVRKRTGGPLVLQTANDIITLDKKCDVYVKELEITVVALVGDEAPALLSLGKICKEHHYDYIWPHSGGTPYLVGADRRKIYCEPVNNVPQTMVW